MTDPLLPFVPEALVGELRALIQSTRERVAQTVNSELIWLHWQVGARLRAEVLKDERAACTSPRSSPTRRLCTHCVHN
jgi:hypothetical protein